MMPIAPSTPRDFDCARQWQEVLGRYVAPSTRIDLQEMLKA